MNYSMFMRKLIQIVCLLHIILIPVAAVADEGKMKKAYEAYSQTDYATAIQLYEEILADDFASADLYYNLANAYYKENLVGKAILNYERVLKMDPDNKDAIFNLRLSNLRVLDNVEAPPKLFLAKWGREVLHGRSSRQWGTFALMAVWIALLAGVGYLWGNTKSLKRGFFLLACLVLLFSFGFLGFGLRKSSLEANSQEAIILSPNAYVKSAPDAQSTDLFILHEGIKVNLLDEVGEWTNISLADGKVGWVANNVLEEI